MYLSDTLPDDELQPFFVENSSLIFLVFSDCFFSLEWDVKLKVEVIEDLLYEKNALNIRKRGIRLFLIWYQILGLNATSVCHRLFYNLVPEFGSLIAEYQKREKCDQLKHNHLQARKFSTDTRGQVMQESRSSNVVAPRERVALLTAAALGEDESDYPIHPSRLSYYQLEFACWLATFVYTGPRESSHAISSDCGFDSNFTTHGSVVGTTGPSFNLAGSFPWDTHGDPNDFLLSRHFRSFIGCPGHGEFESGSYSKVNSYSKLSSSPPVQASVYLRNGNENFVQEPTNQAAPNLSPKPNSYLLKDTVVIPSTVQTSPLPQKFIFTELFFNYDEKVVSMVHEVLYGCRQNIDLVQDILHQALLLPLECHKALFFIVTVYGSWLENKHNRPIFMQALDSPMKCINPPVKPQVNASSTEHSQMLKTNGRMNDPKQIQQSQIEDCPIDVTISKDDVGVNDPEELKGCLQNTIQIMLENMANIFYASSLNLNLSESQNTNKISTTGTDYTKYQIDLCRLVLQIFQFASNSNELTSETWSKLLSILMDIMRKTMINTSPNNVQNYKWLSNNKLTQNLFQTLNGALLRASLFSTISSESWDQCLNVYSQLSHWPSLIIEWKKVMRMLTCTMSKLVYGVDLSDLPQEKKGPRIKRLAGSTNPATRTRPKSLTEAALNYHNDNTIITTTTNITATTTTATTAYNSNSLATVLSSPPAPYASALSVLSIHQNSLDDDNLALNTDSIELHLSSQENSQKQFATYNELKASRNDNNTRPCIEKWTFDPGSSENYALDNNSNGNVVHSYISSNVSSINGTHDESNSQVLSNDLTEVYGNHALHSSRSISHELSNQNESNRFNVTVKSEISISGSRRMSSVRRATSEITLEVVKNHHSAPQAMESSCNPRFSRLTRDDHDCQLHPELSSHHRLSDSLNLLTTVSTAALLGRFSHPVSMSFTDDKQPTYSEKASVVHHSGSTIFAISCLEDSLSLSQNGLNTGSCASGEEIPNESLKFDLDSPQSPVTTYFDESIDVGTSNIPRSCDILSDEHSTLEPSRKDTLTTAPSRLVSTTNETSKLPSTASNDQLDAADLPRCILAGGSALGWTHESVVICWRRFLGILGSLHKIINPTTMNDTFNYLNEMTSCLLKIRAYQIVPSVTETCVQPIPQFVPPVNFIAPILFNTMSLSEEFIEAKRIAIRTLCDIVIRSHDGCPDPELIAHFYHLIHQISVAKRENYVFEVIRSCNMRLFGSSLPSTHLLILDFLSDVNIVLSNPNCGTESKLVRSLIQAVLSDPSGEVRCLAITGLSIYCVIELVNSFSKESGTVSSVSFTSMDNLFFESIIILLGMMRFQNRAVSIVAVEMINTLAEYCHLLLYRDAKLPSLMLLSLAWTLYSTWDNTNLDSMSLTDKQFFHSLIQSIIEWSIRIPYDQLIKNFENKSELKLLPASNLLDTIIEVLCFIISNNTNSQTLMNSVQNSNYPQSKILSSINFTDPLGEYINIYKQSIDINLFNAPKSDLDLSTMTAKSWIVANAENSMILYHYNDDMNSAMESVRLAARMAMSHLLNHIDQFPMSKQCVQLNTSIQERHDQLSHSISSAQKQFTTNNHNNMDDLSELTAEIFGRNNLQIFVLDRSIILTFLSLPIVKLPDQLRNINDNLLPTTVSSDKDNTELQVLEFNNSTYSYLPLSYLNSNDVEVDSSKSSLVTDKFYTRIITRDLSGKYSWDVSYLYASLVDMKEKQETQQLNELTNTNLRLVDSDNSNSHLITRDPPPCPPPRVNPPPLTTNRLTPNTIDQLDRLSDVLRDLAITSPECSINWCTSKLCEYENSKNISDKEKTACLNMEKVTCDQITAQYQIDENVNHRKLPDIDVLSLYNSHISLPKTGYRNSLKYTIRSLINDKKINVQELESMKQNTLQFYNSRHLLNQLGYLSWKHRPTVELLQISPALIRELKHLDHLGSRETHKLAIFYVGAGQEDKQSILSNQTASLEFENFVAGLGWEVDLLKHKGFRGGLECSGRAGLSTPYYATSTLEVIFHVSTRMPSSTQEDFKYKHLGNDEIMIIWNENSRAFRRSILRTQFGDVLIIISPLLNGLFKVEVRREAQVGLFGPIVENAILTANVLPGLVRATAINASRAVQATKPGYRHPYPFLMISYEDRASSLRQIISKYTLSTCFEEYAESILLPNSKSVHRNQSNLSFNRGVVNKSGGVKFSSVSPTTQETYHSYSQNSASDLAPNDITNNNNALKYTDDVAQTPSVRQRQQTVSSYRATSAHSRTSSVTRAKSMFSRHHIDNLNTKPISVISQPSLKTNSATLHHHNETPDMYKANVFNSVPSPRLFRGLRSRQHSGSNKIN
uniref:Ral GTPase-activating protein subunit alpha-1 n=1 Tax=Schistosoma haematobium TaxID=6185 RepID=A0A094ZE55_SCHHA